MKNKYAILHQQMFNAHQSGDSASRDRFRVEMETFRQSQIAKLGFDAIELASLSSFVARTLNKNQEDLGIPHASNCINAAFNYHNEFLEWEPYSTFDMLERIRFECKQIIYRDELVTGDLVTFWSRNGKEWENQRIDVKELDPRHPQFPFGLVFDHIAVYIGNNRLFHKPDPIRESSYQINNWEDVISFYEVLPGFELTFHRRLD